MADLLVRDLDDKVVKRLRARAKSGGRSLQGEIKSILEQAAARPTAEERKRLFRDLERRFAGRVFSDSAELIREDRER